MDTTTSPVSKALQFCVVSEFLDYGIHPCLHACITSSPAELIQRLRTAFAFCVHLPWHSLLSWCILV